MWFFPPIMCQKDIIKILLKVRQLFRDTIEPVFFLGIFHEKIETGIFLKAFAIQELSILNKNQEPD